MSKMITITKVVTKNFVMDWWARIQNIIGTNLKTYEDMCNEGLKQIEDELTLKSIEIKERKYQITQLTNGALLIMMYGEQK